MTTSKTAATVTNADTNANAFNAKIAGLFKSTNGEFDKLEKGTLPKASKSEYEKLSSETMDSIDVSVPALLTSLQSTLYSFQLETSTALSTMHTHINKSHNMVSNLLNSSIEELFSHIQSSLQQQRMLENERRMHDEHEMKVKMEEYESRIRRLETIIEQQSHSQSRSNSNYSMSKLQTTNRHEEDLDDIDFVDPDEQDSSFKLTIPKLSQTVPPISFSSIRDQIDAKIKSGHDEKQSTPKCPPPAVSSSRETIINNEMNKQKKEEEKTNLNAVTEKSKTVSSNPPIPPKPSSALPSLKVKGPVPYLDDPSENFLENPKSLSSLKSATTVEDPEPYDDEFNWDESEPAQSGKIKGSSINSTKKNETSAITKPSTDTQNDSQETSETNLTNAMNEVDLSNLESIESLTLSLYISARCLPTAEGKNHPIAALFIAQRLEEVDDGSDEEEFAYVSQTEWLRDIVDANFEVPLLYDYERGHTNIRIDLYDVENEAVRDEDRIGSVVIPSTDVLRILQKGDTSYKLEHEDEDKHEISQQVVLTVHCVIDNGSQSQEEDAEDGTEASSLSPTSSPERNLTNSTKPSPPPLPARLLSQPEQIGSSTSRRPVDRKEEVNEVEDEIEEDFDFDDDISIEAGEL